MQKVSGRCRYPKAPRGFGHRTVPEIPGHVPRGRVGQGRATPRRPLPPRKRREPKTRHVPLPQQTPVANSAVRDASVASLRFNPMSPGRRCLCRRNSPVQLSETISGLERPRYAGSFRAWKLHAVTIRAESRLLAEASASLCCCKYQEIHSSECQFCLHIHLHVIQFQNFLHHDFIRTTG